MITYTIDFETYYDSAYSLSKMPMSEYIRDARFEVIGVGVKEGESPAVWMRPEEFAEWATSVPWGDVAILCHHAHFDGAILSWKYKIRPRFWFDTLSMARAVIGGYAKSHSLDATAKSFGFVKGDEVMRALGKRFKDFSAEEYERYGLYCRNDCEITYGIFLELLKGMRAQNIQSLPGKFPYGELEFIDTIIRMYTEPVFEFDGVMLSGYLADLKKRKTDILLNVAQYMGVVVTPLDDVETTVSKILQSNPKFALELERLGIAPPVKVSPTTGKEIFAFAKTDEALEELLEHPDERVQAVVGARVKTKSTILETRTAAFRRVSEQGAVPIYLKYSGADQTHRLSGAEGNFQNLPRKSPLRDALCAPPGYAVVVVDSANIEARVVDALAGEESMLVVYRKNDAKLGPDVYCYMASQHYGREITPADEYERQLFKVVKLACGFGMGGAKFKETARLVGGLTLSAEEATARVDGYRNTHRAVVALWKRFDRLIQAMQSGERCELDPQGVLTTTHEGICLPNGLVVKYPGLRKTDSEWVFSSGRVDSVKLYGGKCVENAVQALARIIVMAQCMHVCRLHPEARMPLVVHDEGVWVVPENKAEEVLSDAIQAFRTPPTWWPSIPLNAEGHIAVRYGWAK